MSSAGQEALEVAEVAGLYLDPWEKLVITDALGETAAARWAAFRIGLEVARQNGKGAILECRELAGLFAFGERLIIHSAHEQATASEHFRRILALMEGVPEFDRRILKVVRGKGLEAIELRDGYRIFFKTRTGGGGRGFTGNLIVFDEAMMLAAAFMAALVPTLAAQSKLGDPQLWFAGSAVDQQKHEHGVEFARVRAAALDGSDPRLAYFGWNAPFETPDDLTDADLDDPEHWATANPGMGIRITPEYIADERKALGAREFAVERLGVGDWPATDGGGDGIDATLWDAALDRASQVLDPVTLAVDTTPNRAMTAIGAAGWRADGQKHVEVLAHRPGTAWVGDLLEKILEKQSATALKIDGRGAAASLIPELEQRALPVEIETVSSSEHVQACGAMFDAIHGTEDPETGVRTGQTVKHIGQPELTAAARGAVKRPLGDAFAWNRKSSGVDISPLVVCTLALWGCIEAGQVGGGFEWD